MRGHLGADVQTMPAAWRGVIKATLGEFLTLIDTERESLSGYLREQAEEAVIKSTLRTGQKRRARKKAADETARRGASFGAHGADFELMDDSIRAAFDSGDLPAAAEQAGPVLESFFGDRV